MRRGCMPPCTSHGKMRRGACYPQHALLTERAYNADACGLVAEWLRRGLQILAPRFDSGRGLHRPAIDALMPAATQPRVFRLLATRRPRADASADVANSYDRMRTPSGIIQKPSTGRNPRNPANMKATPSATREPRERGMRNSRPRIEMVRAVGVRRSWAPNVGWVHAAWNDGERQMLQRGRARHALAVRAYGPRVTPFQAGCDTGKKMPIVALQSRCGLL